MWETKTGKVKTGRERKILWKDFPGDAARRWVQRSRGQMGTWEEQAPAWDDEKPRTTHPSELHMQLGLRLQTRRDPFQKLPPPMPTCSDSTGAHGGCGHPVFVDGEGKPCQEMHWYSCSPIFKNILTNHSLGKKKKKPYVKLKWSSLGHSHDICLKPSLVKKVDPEGLRHHGQAALDAFSLTADSITAPTGTTAPPRTLGSPGITRSVGGHLSHEQICSGGGKKAAGQQSYTHRP